MKNHIPPMKSLVPAVSTTTLLAIIACSSNFNSGEVKVFISPELLGLTQHQATPPLLFAMMNPRSHFHGVPALNAQSDDNANKVTCVGLNVMGPNISSALPSEGSAAWNNQGTSVVGGSKCGYVGVVSQILPVSTSAMIKVAVPYGNSRVVQLVGYKGVNCSQKLTSTDLTSSSTVPGVYEIGRAVSDIFTRKPEIEIEVDTDVIARIESPSLTDKTLFVPDLRCGVVGNETKQFETLVAGAGTTTTTPTPTPTPTATSTPGGGGGGDNGGGTGGALQCGENEYVAGTSCVAMATDDEVLSCANTNQYVVGIKTIKANQGASTPLLGIYLNCSSFSGTTRSTPDIVGPKGSSTGQEKTLLCGATPDNTSSQLRAIFEINSYTAAGLTEGIGFKCRGIDSSNPGTEIKDGENNITLGSSICQNGHSVTGFVLAKQLTTLAAIKGIICRANPTP